jgi:phenylacetate-coenzyme A ligase PaaK-like adenylate-forming protein
MKFEELRKKIFEIKSDNQLNEIALEIFHFQYDNNPVYHQYVDLNNIRIEDMDHYKKIPFLPIELFKSHKINSGNFEPEKVFSSSGTTGISTSKHNITNLGLYEKSFLACFELFYGKPDQYLILALLPSYLERENSSLVFMVEKIISLSNNSGSGFYLDNYDDLAKKISNPPGRKILLIGVTFALLDLAEKFNLNLKNGIVMETGGMKGRRKEIVREELHRMLSSKFHSDKIHSEYGMTELLSQAYSNGDGIFRTPPWMKILIRDTNDPKSLLGDYKSGGINIIDLANLYSCSFIATQDLGKTYPDGSFEVLGRFDNSDIRGCNLMIQ